MNQSSGGVPGTSFAGQADISSDGRFVAFVSGADDLAEATSSGGSEGDLLGSTQSGILIQAVPGPGGALPKIVSGKAVFEYVATAPKFGPAPSRAYVELKLCNTAAGEPNLVARLAPLEDGSERELDAHAELLSELRIPG